MSKSNIEHQHQVQFIRWCKAQRVDIKSTPFFLPFAEPKETIADYIFAIPNGGKREQKTKVIRGQKRQYSPEGVRLKLEGCKAGVHDLMLPAPIWGYSGLYIETKKPVSKDYANPTVSTEQKEFGERMLRAGYAVAYCWGFNQMVDAITAYFKGDHETLKTFAIPRASRK